MLVLISSSGEVFLPVKGGIVGHCAVCNLWKLPCMEELQADAKRKADEAKQVPLVTNYHPIIHISSLSSHVFLPERTTYWMLHSFLA